MNTHPLDYEQKTAHIASFPSYSMKRQNTPDSAATPLPLKRIMIVERPARMYIIDAEYYRVLIFRPWTTPYGADLVSLLRVDANSYTLIRYIEERVFRGCDWAETLTREIAACDQQLSDPAFVNHDLFKRDGESRYPRHELVEQSHDHLSAQRAYVVSDLADLNRIVPDWLRQLASDDFGEWLEVSHGTHPTKLCALNPKLTAMDPAIVQFIRSNE
jgi:hypothetical protein